ncbi:TPA: hypothetical protein N0F65_006353 [Lagenidium giganteum]|uniref:Kazal-like domain-containing protein n=1 Tax=Lagenidium giganteum TaxID=4803 RepID=A0AAV2YJD6_9STRA|nr:TPA: hypothetical protein N0F65_006353 [Lagenidium giganteum]
MRWLLVPLLLLSIALLHTRVYAQWLIPQSLDSSGFISASCSRPCGRYEICFVYEDDEYCADYCAPGRCDDSTELCILQGASCNDPPCLPRAVCEPKSHQASTSTDTSAIGSCGRLCPAIASPVCARRSDNTLVSYANRCFFDLAQCLRPTLVFVGPGICDIDAQQNLRYDPIGAIGTAPVPHPACDAITCADVLDPVCTNNGTMKNMCVFKKAQCSTPLTLFRRGPCEPVEPLARCPTSCTEEFQPICASNGVIYANECLFRRAKCDRSGLGLKAKDMNYCRSTRSSALDFRSLEVPVV